MKFGPAYVLYTVVSLGLLTYLFAGHLTYASKFTNLALCHSLMWVHLTLKTVCSLLAKPHVARPGSSTDALSVDIVVPIYNEDPHLLAAGVRSVAGQTRLPRALWLVDDGCRRDGEDFHILRDPEVLEAIKLVRAAGVLVFPRRQENQGKRYAQSAAFSRSDADVFITVDSDTVLRNNAVEKILVPFTNPKTMSVAGTACGQNYGRSLFTRVVEVGFVMSFIQGRMAEGVFGSVRVNCGILAAYRGEVVRENLDRYLGQRFLNRPVKAGDDRLLTLFAKEKGRVEFQPEAVAYSALPVRLSHLVRQRLRWCRSFCWGTLWLLRRPLSTADFWFTFTQITALAMYAISMSIAVVGGVTGAVSVDLFISTVVTATGISLVSHSRYVILARPGESLWQRLLTWWVSPLASLLSLLVLIPLYFVAILSPRPQRSWGTRQRVEVELDKRGAGATIDLRDRTLVAARPATAEQSGVLA